MQTPTCANCGATNLANARYCSRCGHELPKTEQAPVAAPLPPLSKKKSRLKPAQWIGIIAGIAAMYAVQYFFFRIPSYDKQMVEMASEINKTCPLMIDAETRLDNAIALPANLFQYNYTLVNTDRSQVDTLALKTMMEPNIVNFVKTEPQMSYQREKKTTINYSYRDKKGNYLFMVSVTPEKYE